MKRPVLDRSYLDWITREVWLAKVQKINAGMETIDCRFDVVISVPTSRHDTDNWTKALMDLMQAAGIVSNDGNMNRVTIEPVDRDDCSVAIFPRPDLGHVRKQAKGKKLGWAGQKKTDRKRLDRIAAVRSKVLF